MSSDLGRKTHIDISRGITSTLIVTHHVVVGLSKGGFLSSGTTLPALEAIFGIWRMPFYFLIAGFFLPRLATKYGLFGLVGERLRTVAWPFFLWGIAQVSIMVLLSGVIRTKMTWLDIARFPIDPPGQFWFLQFLFVFSILGAAMIRFAPRAILVLATGTIAFSLFWVQYRMSFDYRISMGLGWFMMGVWLSNSRLMEYLGDFRYSRALSFGAVLAYCCIFPFVSDRIPLLGLTATGVATILVLGRALEGTALGKLAAVIGRSSLKIYLLHIFFLAAVRIAISSVAHINHPGIHLPAGIIAGVSGPILFAALASKIHADWLFTFPGRPASKSVSRQMN